MQLDHDVFHEALRQSLSAKHPFFDRYHRSDPGSLRWLLNWPLPPTVEALFTTINDLPSYGDPHFCNGPVIYALLQALNATQEGQNLTFSAERLQDRDTVHHGSLVIKGHLSNEGCIYVTGNMTIEGNLLDWDECSRLVVLGDLEVQNISTSGEIIVGGDVRVHHTVHAHRNDHGLYVGGTLHSPVLINSDHHIVASARSFRPARHKAAPKAVAARSRAPVGSRSPRP